jgi:DNA-binding MarR family transcriptional regulator
MKLSKADASAMTQLADSLAQLLAVAARTHGAMVAAGDELVGDLDLSSAREQLLGALLAAGAPRTVSQLGRDLDLTRQAVQRVADDLADAGLAAYSPNPDHARAKLLAPTDIGREAYAEALRRKGIWLEGLAQGLPPAGLEIAVELLRLLGRRVARKTV